MDLVLLTADPDPDAVLPALTLLAHSVRPAAPDASALLEAGPCEVALVDARIDLAGARSLCRLLGGAALNVPVAAILTEGGLVAVSPDWGLDDVLLAGTGPAELDARLRLLIGRHQRANTDDTAGLVTLGELSIDEGTYSARLRGKPLDLTYKEFELLKFLAQHAGRVFTRAQLLHKVWGYDFFGGTRTVDVHVRRLRAKLGAEHEALIGTVRNVGYKAVRPSKGASAAESDRERDEPEPERESHAGVESAEAVESSGLTGVRR